MSPYFKTKITSSRGIGRHGNRTLQAAIVAQRRAKQIQTTNRLSDGEEMEAIAIQIRLNSCVMNELANALRNYLTTKNVTINGSMLDVSIFMDAILQQWKQDPSLLPSVLDKNYVFKTLKTARNGRNAVAHGNLYYVLRNWKEYLEAFITICHWINESCYASNIQAMKNEMEFVDSVIEASSETWTGLYILHTSEIQPRIPPAVGLRSKDSTDPRLNF